MAVQMLWEKKPNMALVPKSSSLGSSTFTHCTPTPLVLEGSQRSSSDKWNARDMWHQKALRLVTVIYSYILMLVLKLSEPTCGGSVSNDFHILHCTDQSFATDVLPLPIANATEQLEQGRLMIL